MPAFAHTPYDGSHKPFTIGVSLLDPNDWIEPDEHLVRHLARKDELFAAGRDAVFREEPETRAAQAEVLAMLADFLPARSAEIWRRDGSHMDILPAGRTIDLDGDAPPLLTASRLVQEDLCLMRDGPGGYRLAAASLCFPSSWSLTEKFGMTLDGLHGNVPGYPDFLAGRMARIFAHMKAEMPVKRLNWSIYTDDDLHHPQSKSRPRNWFEEEGEFSAFVRVERQTLRRLPVSGDILFTIKIYVDPLEAFRTHPDGARLALGLRDDILGMNAGQLAYKALDRGRERLVRALEAIAGEGGSA
jgi:hypothetical protein